ncbi:MAG: hypothetical protein AUH74_05810 [Nitrospirae bacterium 13_1_40CM_4_62_6]|nr:MAG: hypothetical protein AUH74_05810 [Nitrospirae bacterium 13_1_40CM_4_62_6]
MATRVACTRRQLPSHRTERKKRPRKPKTYAQEDSIESQESGGQADMPERLLHKDSKSSTDEKQHDGTVTNPPHPVGLAVSPSMAIHKTTLCRRPDHRSCGSWLCVPCLLVCGYRFADHLPVLLDDPVRDLSAGHAAIGPVPAADVELPVVLEQIVHEFFHHECVAACAFHADLLCNG